MDLLVVMAFRGNAVVKAIQIRSRFDTPFPLDLIVRKPEFIVRREGERGMFIELFMIEGQAMFPLPGARLSSPKSSSVYRNRSLRAIRRGRIRSGSPGLERLKPLMTNSRD